MLNFEIRKKYFSILAKKISDVFATVTGIPPLSLPNSKGKNLKSYSISGNVDEEIIGFSGSDVVLPDGYRQLEYIQTDGNSYINTNVIPFNNIGVKVTFYALGNMGASGYSPIFGTRKASQRAEFQLTTFDGWGLRKGAFCAGDSRINAGITNLTRQTIMFQGTTYTKPDGTTATIALYDWANSGIELPILLGATNATTVQRGAGSRYYEFIIYYGNEIFRRFVPCVNAENTVGMYEIIEGKFHGNAGTGTIIASPFNLLRTAGRTEQAVSGDSTGEKRVLRCDKYVRGIATNNGLISYATTNVQIGANGVSCNISAPDGTVALPVKLKNNVSYSINATISSGGQLRIISYQKDGTFNGEISASASGTVKRFTVPNNADIVCMLLRRAGSTDESPYTFSDIMLVEGTYTSANMPTYTPYKQLLTDYNGVGDYDSTINKYKIPVLSSGTHNIIINNSLYKIGKNIDTVNYPQNKMVKAVGNYVFTGNEAIELYDNSKGFCFAIADMETGNCLDGFCNRFENFKNVTDNDVPRVFFGYNNNYVYFRRVTSTSVTKADMQAILADWYSNGKPLTIWYPLEEEVEEAITLPDIPTIRGNATIMIDTEVQPSEVTVEYATEEA